MQNKHHFFNLRSQTIYGSLVETLGLIPEIICNTLLNCFFPFDWFGGFTRTFVIVLAWSFLFPLPRRRPLPPHIIHNSATIPSPLRTFNEHSSYLIFFSRPLTASNPE